MGRVPGRADGGLVVREPPERAVAEVVAAYVRYRTAVRSWETMSEAILEAVTEKFRRDALIV